LQTKFYIFRFSTPCILAVNNFFLLQLYAHNTLKTYIYHQLPPTCFGVCYTILREIIALRAQKLYALCSVVIKAVLTKIVENIKQDSYLIIEWCPLKIFTLLQTQAQLATLNTYTANVHNK